MYRLFLTVVFLSIADLSTSVSSIFCGKNTASYCRPSAPHKYGLPHNDYHGYGQGQSVTTELPPVFTSAQPTPATGNVFEDLAQNLIAAESALRKYCTDNIGANVKEIYGDHYYVLKYTVPNSQPNDVSVLIKHRVISVTIQKSGVAVYKNIRLLPSILNTEQASWTYGSGLLEIYIPYSVIYNKELENQCPVINDALIIVPVGTFTYRTGNRPYQQNQPQGVYGNSGSGQYTGNNYNSQVPNNDGSLDDALTGIFGSSDDQQSFDVRNAQ